MKSGEARDVSGLFENCIGALMPLKSELLLDLKGSMRQPSSSIYPFLKGLLSFREGEGKKPSSRAQSGSAPLPMCLSVSSLPSPADQSFWADRPPTRPAALLLQCWWTVMQAGAAGCLVASDICWGEEVVCSALLVCCDQASGS
ncbi:hypothetical protein CHARACLAT_000438 [Characodon lateralis]|uniref:Uncharacterized protein n=1 Tax=Characodon lateralis TaxID=208331 RepID=A0ABU7EQY4_9TELE|nr:hypothetical protein [Characodon lateralis]